MTGYAGFMQLIRRKGAVLAVAFAEIQYAGERFVTEITRARMRVMLATVREKGIAQWGRYLNTKGVTPGWLLVAAERPGRTWAERLWREDLVVKARELHLVGV